MSFFTLELGCPNVPWIKEILSGSRSASWLPSLTVMEKNWHRRHTTGGCNPLVRLEKVGSSLETQVTLILAMALLTVVWEHLSPGSPLCSPRDLWEPQLSGACYFPRNKCKDGNLCFRVPGTSGFRLRWYNPFPIHKRPPSSFSFTENLVCSLLQAIFWPPRNTSVATQMTCQTPTLPASGPCFQPHHSFFGPQTWTIQCQAQASCFLDLILHPSAALNHNYYQNYL